VIFGDFLFFVSRSKGGTKKMKVGQDKHPSRHSPFFHRLKQIHSYPREIFFIFSSFTTFAVLTQNINSFLLHLWGLAFG
jgi:hypothetical protein